MLFVKNVDILLNKIYNFMKQTQKIIEEFEKKWKAGVFYSDFFITINQEKVKSFLLSSLHQIATEAIEAVKLEKKLEQIPTSTTTDYPRIIMEEAGYNYAISEMEQKAKKFLEDNF